MHPPDACHGGEVDDGAASTLHGLGHHLLHHEEQPPGVDVLGLVPVCLCDLQAGLAPHQAGALDQHVDLPQSLAHPGDSRGDGVNIGQIHGKPLNRTQGGQLSGGFIQDSLVHIHQSHLGSGLQQRFRADIANAAGCAGNYGNLSRKIN